VVRARETSVSRLPEIVNLRLLIAVSGLAGRAAPILDHTRRRGKLPD
jgi:hypothetical protein